MSDHVMPTYARLPVSFVKGAGVYLWDEQGRRYLDAIAGIAVCNLGHVHPAVVEALTAQANTLIHTSNLYGIQRQEELADRLCELSGMDKVFFSNSGAEANEAAIKLARRYGHSKGIDIPHIIVMEGAFHGRTMATVTATSNAKAQEGFGPLLQGFIRVPYNDVEAIKMVASERNDVVAILVEPIQGEGGVNVPAEDYLNQLRDVCDAHDWLLMVDEIQTGIGRTGQWFAHQHNHIKPDVMTLAKALGNGFPIGACLAAGKAAGVLTAGSHGSTYGGNSLGCATALRVLDTIEDEEAIENAAEMGGYMRQQFEQKFAGMEAVVEIRQKGLMIGIELDKPCGELVAQALQKGVLINVTAGKNIRLLPPLIITVEQADEIVATVSELVQQWAEVSCGA